MEVVRTLIPFLIAADFFAEGLTEMKIQFPQVMEIIITCKE